MRERKVAEMGELTSVQVEVGAFSADVFYSSVRPIYSTVFIKGVFTLRIMMNSNGGPAGYEYIEGAHK